MARWQHVVEADMHVQSTSCSSLGIDRVYSSPDLPYELRQCLSRTRCPFLGSPSVDTESTSSSTSVAARTTVKCRINSWDVLLYRSLDFTLIPVDPTPPHASENIPRTCIDMVTERVMQMICHKLPTTKDASGVLMDPPKIADTLSMSDQTVKTWIANDAALNYVTTLYEAVLKKREIFNVDRPTAKMKPKFVDYLDFVLASKSFIWGKLRETTVQQIHALLVDIYDACAIGNGSELKLNRIVHDTVLLVVLVEKVCNLYKTKLFQETLVKFTVCGSQVTSETNVLVTQRSKDDKMIPILLSENKIHSDTADKETSKAALPPYLKRQKAQEKKLHHKKISEVMRQCVCVANNSPFETSDYKCVYHVCLMNTEYLLVTRTHVAKSALNIIQDRCVCFSQVELSPSYLFEGAYRLSNQPFFIFNCLYRTILILIKMAELNRKSSSHAACKVKKTSLMSRFGKRKASTSVLVSESASKKKHLS